MIPFWFAVSSPFIVGSDGFVGSMVCYLAQYVAIAEPWRIRRSRTGNAHQIRSILGSLQCPRHGALARLKESTELGELFRLKCVAKSRHVHATVHDADDNVALGKCVAYVCEIGSATTADAID